VGEPVVAGLDASAVDQHLRIGGQAGKRAAQMFVHLKKTEQFMSVFHKHIFGSFITSFPFICSFAWLYDSSKPNCLIQNNIILAIINFE
jgi:hypothetical protein